MLFAGACGGVCLETILSYRLAADLAVMEHFSKAYAAEFAAALKTASPEEASDRIIDLFKAKKDVSSVYEHRLSSILEV